jgi:hypothetical protein
MTAVVIEILGIDGEKTDALETAVRKALADLSLQDGVSLLRVSDPAALIARGARRWPALRVDGRVVCSGATPTAAEIRVLLEAAEV